jgi:hypothetical protein
MEYQPLERNKINDKGNKIPYHSYPWQQKLLRKEWLNGSEQKEEQEGLQR